MRLRNIRCTLRYTERGKEPLTIVKDSKFTMADQTVHIMIEPVNGKCTLSIDAQTESDTLPLPIGCPMVLTWPHNGMSHFGGGGNPTPVMLNLVPATARVMGLITDIGGGNVQVHIVDTQVTCHGLILGNIPELARLEKLEIIIEPLA